MENRFDRIEAYLLGELKGAELETFAEEMKADPKLRMAVVSHYQAIRSVRVGALKGELEKIHKRLEAQGVLRKRSYQGFYFAAAAAMIAFLVAAYLGAFTNKPQYLLAYEEMHVVDPGLPTLMGVSEDPVFDEAMVAYRMGDYSGAVAGFERVLEVYPENDTVQYYLGMSYLEQKDRDIAVMYLNKVRGSESVALREKADWYLVMAYLQGGEVDKAKQVVGYIEKQEGHKYVKNGKVGRLMELLE